jgi:hypothetical protein
MVVNGTALSGIFKTLFLIFHGADITQRRVQTRCVVETDVVEHFQPGGLSAGKTA